MTHGPGFFCFPFSFSPFHSSGCLGNPPQTDTEYTGEIFDFIDELAKKKFINSFTNTKEELTHRLKSWVDSVGGDVRALAEEHLMRFMVSWSANRGRGRSQTIAPQTAKRYIRLLRDVIREQYQVKPDLLFPLLARWEKGWISDIITNRSYEMKQANFFPVSLIQKYICLMDKDIVKLKRQDLKVSTLRSRLYYACLIRTAMLISFATGNRMCEILQARLINLSFHETSGMKGMLIKIGRSKSDLEGNRTGQISCFAIDDDICPVKAVSVWLKYTGVVFKADGTICPPSPMALIFPMFQTNRKVSDTYVILFTRSHKADWDKGSWGRASEPQEVLRPLGS